MQVKHYGKTVTLWFAAIAMAGSAVSASADQFSGSAQIGNTLVTLGAGGAIIVLPDTRSLMTRGNNSLPLELYETFKLSEDYGEEKGAGFDISFETPLDNGNDLIVSGFFQSFDQENRYACVSPNLQIGCTVTALVDSDPDFFDSSRSASNTYLGEGSRQVNHLGVDLGVRAPADAIIPGGSFLLGVDFRQIDQKIHEDSRFPNGAKIHSYSESLTTNYYGGYVGAELELGEPAVSGFGGSGLTTNLFAKGGIYFADTQYDGSLTGFADQKLSLNSGDTAFIGSVGFETTLPLAPNIHISLVGKAEYYSFVPEMRYNQIDEAAFFGIVQQANGQDGTVIGNSDAFSGSLMLRLIVELGG